MSKLSRTLAALAAAVSDGSLALPVEDVPESVHVERPRQREHGDWATNVALQLAKKAGIAPRALAEDLAARLASTPGVAKVDVAGPGFLNITLAAGAAGEDSAGAVVWAQAPAAARLRPAPRHWRISSARGRGIGRSFLKEE